MREKTSGRVGSKISSNSLSLSDNIVRKARFSERALLHANCRSGSMFAIGLYLVLYLAQWAHCCTLTQANFSSQSQLVIPTDCQLSASIVVSGTFILSSLSKSIRLSCNPGSTILVDGTLTINNLELYGCSEIRCSQLLRIENSSVINCGSLGGCLIANYTYFNRVSVRNCSTGNRRSRRY